MKSSIVLFLGCLVILASGCTTTSKQSEGISENYAPYGRLIKCELVMPIDSSHTETPIIGLVSNDLYHNNKLIIPAGAEIHGQAQGEPVRDRIMTDANWVVVWFDRNSHVLNLKGTALMQKPMTTSDTWSINDASAGLKGKVFQSANLAPLGTTIVAVRKYARYLVDEKRKNAYFVRCSGGTRFYLYVQQTIDLEKAEIAATKIKDYKTTRR